MERQQGVSVLITDTTGEHFCGCPWQLMEESLLFRSPQGSSRTLPQSGCSYQWWGEGPQLHPNPKQ